MADDGEETRAGLGSRPSPRMGTTAEPMQGKSRGIFDRQAAASTAIKARASFTLTADQLHGPGSFGPGVVGLIGTALESPSADRGQVCIPRRRKPSCSSFLGVGAPLELYPSVKQTDYPPDLTLRGQVAHTGPNPVGRKSHSLPLRWFCGSGFTVI